MVSRTATFEFAVWDRTTCIKRFDFIPPKDTFAASADLLIQEMGTRWGDCGGEDGRGEGGRRSCGINCRLAWELWSKLSFETNWQMQDSLKRSRYIDFTNIKASYKV